MSDISQYMEKKIAALIGMKDKPIGKARLARLRRGTGKIPGEIPELWGEFLEDIPAWCLSKNSVPTKSEWAIYLSLTMFALHQQGNATSVHRSGQSLGKAASQLMEKDTDDERERILRRFGPLVTAKDMIKFSYHLRCLIQLLSSKGIGLDYVRLADDIYAFQFPERRKNVQLKWGQDFYYKKGEEEK